MNKRIRGNIGALALTCLFLICSGSSQEIRSDRSGKSDVILGVLEDRPGRYVGEPNAWRVRVVFEKRGNEWRAYTKPLPDEVSWTIAFDGRRFGRVTTRTRPNVNGFGSDAGFLAITSPTPVPRVGERQQKYAGFPGIPVYRPLVAISKPNYADPDVWKRKTLPEDLAGRIKQKFRKQFPKVMNCASWDSPPAPWPYDDKNIQMGNTYSSKASWYAVELHLSEYKCDGPYEGPFVFQWFIVTPTGEINHLGSEMWLVDAGDYDADGKSEVLFAVAGYNRGGYRLYYADFSKRAEFLYSFH